MTGLADLLARVLASPASPFALVYRRGSDGRYGLDVMSGEVRTPATLADIPLSGSCSRPGHEVLAVVPFRQLSERGMACVDDGSPLIALLIREQAVGSLSEVLPLLPDVPVHLVDAGFDLDDDAYAERVRKVVEEEIGQGEGSNFVLRRSYTAAIAEYGLDAALTVFRRLCEQESGAYWTFLIHTGDRTFVGATPERHVSLYQGEAVMNPISGTYRHPPNGPNLAGLMRFLDDQKESDELHMVVDEELKMMARICDGGGRVRGPRLKEMARVSHTEYHLHGRSRRDPREILRETMFAPTVVGSPLANACQVISRYEPAGRGYYAGVAALIGRDQQGEWCLDSAILIRTADIDRSGRISLGVGATLVRHSDPACEAAETRAKAAGLLSVLDADGSMPLGEHPEVRELLERRGGALAPFWQADHRLRAARDPMLAGRRVLVVDAEDMFTTMIALQLRSLGLKVTVCRYDVPHSWDGYELVVMGPGPGDPRDTGDLRVAHLYTAITTLLAERRPFLAVCLSHQVLSRILGLSVHRCAVPHQGTLREIDLFGRRHPVGFYNTFAAHSNTGAIEVPGTGLVEISRDIDTGEVHALRGPRCASLQFHAESVLTGDGPGIFADLIREVLGSVAPPHGEN
ncbi:anthranilate synthase family protein [Streptomyces chartreusis]|uniref:anthranilate synthase family protein n=1 Tax=Streptomyces chartreusis TaxID=1969 RepID=UPI002E190452